MDSTLVSVPFSSSRFLTPWPSEFVWAAPLLSAKKVLVADFRLCFPPRFAVYEVAFEKICSAAGKKPSELTEGTKTAFNLTSGLIAGLAAAFVRCSLSSFLPHSLPRPCTDRAISTSLQISQPADTLLSLMNKTQGRPGQGMISRIAELSGQLGVKGLFGGMGARFVMIGSITAGQFGLYGSVRSSFLSNLTPRAGVRSRN